MEADDKSPSSDNNSSKLQESEKLAKLYQAAKDENELLEFKNYELLFKIQELESLSQKRLASPSAKAPKTSEPLIKFGAAHDNDDNDADGTRRHDSVGACQLPVEAISEVSFISIIIIVVEMREMT